MIPAAVRRLVRHRAGDRCEYCKLPQELSPWYTFNVEHVLPRQHGGGDEPTNLALACPRCNRLKGPNLTAIDPITGDLVRLFNPRSQLWHDHFKLVGIEIAGVTPIGRATGDLLLLNEESRLEVRAALLENGELEL